MGSAFGESGKPPGDRKFKTNSIIEVTPKSEPSNLVALLLRIRSFALSKPFVQLRSEERDSKKTMFYLCRWVRRGTLKRLNTLIYDPSKVLPCNDPPKDLKSVGVVSEAFQGRLGVQHWQFGGV